MRAGLKIFLGTLGRWIPQGWLIRLTRQYLVLPFYHAVSDDLMPHVAHVYPVRSRSAFMKDLEFFLRHYEPLGLEDLKSPVPPGKRKKPAMFLSFDDGLSEIYDIVAPLLLSKGIPAGIFVNTGFVDNRDLFYRYKSSLLLDRFESIKYSPAVTEEGVPRENLIWRSRLWCRVQVATSGRPTTGAYGTATRAISPCSPDSAAPGDSIQIARPSVWPPCPNGQPRYRRQSRPSPRQIPCLRRRW